MFINRRKRKEDVVHVYSGTLAIKRNKTGSLVVMWMNLDSGIYNEVRKRKTNIIY